MGLSAYFYLNEGPISTELAPAPAPSNQWPMAGARANLKQKVSKRNGVNLSKSFDKNKAEALIQIINSQLFLSEFIKMKK